MGYAEKRGDYWRGRYKIAPASTPRSSRRERGDDAVPHRSATRSRPRTTRRRRSARMPGADPSAGRITFGEYANHWYARAGPGRVHDAELPAAHRGALLPAFETWRSRDIDASDVALWEKRERAAGYAATSMQTWRATLHLILADAVEDGLRDVNPAAGGAGGASGPAVRGTAGREDDHHRARHPADRRAGGAAVRPRRRVRGGGDHGLHRACAGVSWSAWRRAYVRPAAVRVEWQLYELDTGEFHRCPPKDDSRRTVDVPDWLAGLLAEHVARHQPEPCACHGCGTSSAATAPPTARPAGPGRSWSTSPGAPECRPARCRHVLNRPGVGGGGDPRAGVERRSPNSGTSAAAPAGGAGRALAAQRLRDLAVPAGRHGLVPEEGTAAGPAGAGAGRAVARRAGPGPQRRRPGRRVLVADRAGPDAARAAAHVQDADGGAGHPRRS